MSASSKKTENVPAIRQKAEKIAEIVRAYEQDIVEATQDSIVRGISTANALQMLRQSLTDDVMGSVMELQNSPMGFMTDRANAWGNNPKTYPVEVVRDVVIEALLRGLRLHGNEFNILQGRLYITRNGTERKVYEFPGLSKYREDYEPPVIPEPSYEKTQDGKNKAASQIVNVTCHASWELNGVADSMDAVIGVVCQPPHTSVDAVLGKAESKLKKRVYKRLCGMSLPGIAYEEETQGSQPPAAQAAKRKAQVSVLSSLAADKLPTATTEEIEDAKVEPEPQAQQAPAEVEPEQQSGPAPDIGEPHPVDAMSEDEVIERLTAIAEEEAQAAGVPVTEWVKTNLCGIIEGVNYQPFGGVAWFKAEQRGDKVRHARRMSAARTHLAMQMDLREFASKP